MNSKNLRVSLISRQILNVRMELKKQVMLKHPDNHRNQQRLLRSAVHRITLLAERRRQREVTDHAYQV